MFCGVERKLYFTYKTYLIFGSGDDENIERIGITKYMKRECK